MKKQNRNKTEAKDKIVECKYTDKCGIKITLEMLEKLWEQSLKLKKYPTLILGIKRNSKENFMLKCSLQLERK